MLNKYFKIIHNKYSKLFQFIFFLRYLFAIFFISIAIFLVIPNFFNFNKKIEIIKEYLLKNYEFEISKYGEIQFNPLPLPNIELKDVKIHLESNQNKLNVKQLKLYPKIFSIYNFNNFQLNKIIFKETSAILEISSFKSFVKKVLKENNNQLFHNLNIQIIDENKPVISMENMHVSNFGYKKNSITGSIFGKPFKANIKNNFQKINFNLLRSGLTFEIDSSYNQDTNSVSGTFKSKILNSNLKFNFDSDSKRLNIFNSYFRSKNLSFANEGFVIFDPFLFIDLKLSIDDINTLLIKKINFDRLLKSKNFLKKINMKNEFDYKSKKFSRDLIDELNLKVESAYGRINYVKRLSILNNSFECSGNMNFLEDYPVLFFDCLMNLNDNKNIFRKLSIKERKENLNLKLNLIGNLNILNNKINFKKITSNKNYKASKEDLDYFKNTFENILFNESFFEIFDLKKIKEFISEVT